MIKISKSGTILDGQHRLMAIIKANKGIWLHLATELDESIFDVSRFESYRKEDVESIITFPGFKDVIVLLPNNKLIYKP